MSTIRFTRDDKWVTTQYEDGVTETCNDPFYYEMAVAVLENLGYSKLVNGNLTIMIKERENKG